MASSLVRVVGGAFSVMLVASACNGAATDGPDGSGGLDGSGGSTDECGDAPDDYWYGDTGGNPTTGGSFSDDQNPTGGGISDDYWGDWEPTTGGSNPGGASGVSSAADIAAEKEAWLVEQGTQCEPSTALAQSIQDETPVDCDFFELKFPGVFEYSTLAPATKAYEFDSYPSGSTYVGCDAEGSACEGRVAYGWSAEYLSENEWLVTISPKHSGCNYYNVILAQPTEGPVTMPVSTVVWTKFQVVVHAQPTEEGLKIGAITTLEGLPVSKEAYVQTQVVLPSPLPAVVINHLKDLRWQCTH